MTVSRKASALFLVGALLGAFGMSQLPDIQAEPLVAQQSASKQEPLSYRDVVKKVLPAVVSIQTSTPKVSRINRGEPGDGAADPFEGVPLADQRMRKYIEELRKRQKEMDAMPRGPFGSGVVIDAKGVVVTNHHVVAGAEQVEITFKDGSKCVSKSIHSDPETDLAIVKVSCPAPVPYAQLGDSDAMEIGDRVLAVGAPFGLTGSVTHGIISAKGRRDVNLSIYEDFLQTDAAINPGNSGGPLVNMDGQVIGITTAIKSGTGGFQGVGLAIPSNMVRDIVTQLDRDGAVRRGYIGIEMQDLTADLSEKLGLKDDKGVVVGQVFPNTPAAKAGLKEGDVILSVNGEVAKNRLTLKRTIGLAPINKPVEVSLLRNGQKVATKLTIEQRPDDYGAARADNSNRRPRRGPIEGIVLDKLGLEVADLTPELAEQLGYDGAKGVVVTDVEQGGLAHFAGLRRGLLVVQAEKKPVESVEQLKEIAGMASLEKGILLLVRSPLGGSRYVVLKASS